MEISWSLAGSVFAAFGGTFANPIAWLAILAAFALLPAAARNRRLVALSVGLLCAVPDAIAAPSWPETVAAFAGASAGGLLIVEVLTGLVLPVLRLIAWFGFTLLELARYAAARLGLRRRDDPVEARRDA